MKKFYAAAAFWFLSHCAVAASAASPSALVYDWADPFLKASGAGQLFEKAGFQVTKGDLTKELRLNGVNIVVLGSFIAENSNYSAFMKKNAAELRRYVENGGIILQFASADQTEPECVYLTDALKVRRSDEDSRHLFALLPEHPLLLGIQLEGEKSELVLPPFPGEFPPSMETFEYQRGFSVILSADTSGMYPVLLESGWGRGRVLLSSLIIDKQLRNGRVITATDTQTFADLFISNLRVYVETHNAGKLPHISPILHPSHPAPNSWSFVVLPDTQNYLDHLNPGAKVEHFMAQTRWVAENRAQLNIKYVMHLGDITQRNESSEWIKAQAALSRLDGLVPYSIVGGNHDYGPGGNGQGRETLMNSYFPFQKMKQNSMIRQIYPSDRIDNSAHALEAGGRQWVILNLEWAPRDIAVTWASEITNIYGRSNVILITHAYLYHDDTRYDFDRKWTDQDHSPRSYFMRQEIPEGVNDGEMIWRKLVAPSTNIRITLSGHVLGDGLGYLRSSATDGRSVHQMLVNFQMRHEGGEGYLRILECSGDGNQITVKDYSPVLNRFLPGPQSQFRFRLE